jgi:anti-anti-sigma factor
LLTCSPYRLLDIVPAGRATVARINCAQLWDEGEVLLLRGQLCRLVEQAGCRNLVLDLGGVESLVSSMTSLLISLNKKTRESGGRLALCGLNPWVTRVLETLRLDRYFDVYPGVDEAIQSFAAGAAGAGGD